MESIKSPHLLRTSYHLLAMRLLPWSLLLTISCDALGIPGTTQTERGYDTELGSEAICWKSKEAMASSSDDAAGGEKVTPFPNELIQDFSMIGSIEILSSCPTENAIYATAPVEILNGERLRTGRLYTYHANLTLNVASLGGTAFVSDNSTHFVAVQVLVCQQGSSGFCSPFIHEESNARLAEMGIFEPTGHGESHGGTHVHSPFVRVWLDPKEGPFYQKSIEVPMLVNDPGNYFAIAAVQMFVVNTTATESIEHEASIAQDSPRGAAVKTFMTPNMRYDMANALVGEQRLLSYQDPPIVLTVPYAVQVASYVAIAIAASIIFYLLVETFRYRNHQILKLTQGGFLIVFLLAGLGATVGALFLDPKNGLFCQAGFPIVLTSLQLSYAITVGRLWRINAVISPLLIKTLKQEESCTTRVFRVLAACSRMSTEGLVHPAPPADDAGGTSKRPQLRSKAVRRKVTSAQLAMVIAVFTIPQVILQIAAVIAQPRSRHVLFNEDESIGSECCTAGKDVPIGRSLLYYGYYLFLLLLVVLLCMAHATRRLPCLFNETHLIYDSTLSSLVLMLLGFGIILVTRGPTVSPAIEYMIWVTVILSMTLQSSLRIMLPKLRMARKDETVLVSQLVTCDTASVYNKGNRFTSQTSSLLMRASSTSGSGGHGSSRRVVHVSGLSPPAQQEPSLALSHTASSAQSLNPFLIDDEAGDTKPADSKICRKQDLNSQLLEEGRDNSAVAPKAQSRTSRRGRYIVAKGETPAKSLLLKLLEMQNQLNHVVTERVMSGLVVEERDWECLRTLLSKTASTFETEVQFEWEGHAVETSAASTALATSSHEPEGALQRSKPMVNEHVESGEQRQHSTRSKTCGTGSGDSAESSLPTIKEDNGHQFIYV